MCFLTENPTKANGVSESKLNFFNDLVTFPGNHHCRQKLEIEFSENGFDYVNA